MSADQSELPLYFGKRITKTTFSVNGTVESVDAQPPRIMTDLGEEVFLVVRGVVSGATQKRDELGVIWRSKVEVLECHELGSEMGRRLTEQLREETITIIDARLGRMPIGSP